ncbi:MAG: glycosyltransferase [Pirellulales bacterium]
MELLRSFQAHGPVTLSQDRRDSRVVLRKRLDDYELRNVELADPTEHPRRPLATKMFDEIFCETWKQAEPWIGDAGRLQPWSAFVVDSVDVHFVREEMEQSLGLLDAKLVAENKRRELAVYRAGDAIVVVTADDRAALLEQGIRCPIFVIPNIVPFLPRRERPRKRELSFIAGFKHRPNVDGLLWFVENCWERIRLEVPDAELTIVGSNAGESVLALAERPGITVAGFVPSTEPYLDAAAVSIAPLRYGGGLKGKVCEAMAAGVPVVGMPAALQGIPAQDRISVRIADDPITFSAAVVELLRDSVFAEKLGAEGRKVVAEICGPDVVRSAVEELMSWLAARPAPSFAQRCAWQLARRGWLTIHACRRWARRVYDSRDKRGKAVTP